MLEHTEGHLNHNIPTTLATFARELRMPMSLQWNFCFHRLIKILRSAILKHLLLRVAASLSLTKFFSVIWSLSVKHTR